MTQYWTGANDGMYGTQRAGRSAVETDLKGGKRGKKVEFEIKFQCLSLQN
jgi:hypothetical protein